MKIVFIKRIIIFLCIFCITWSCSSDNNDVFCEEELIEETNLLASPLDLPYNLIYPLKEPFVAALTALYKDELGKKLCKLTKKIFGDGYITLSYDPTINPGEMKEGGFRIFKYSSFSDWNDKAIGGLLGHEFFHVFQRSGGSVNLRNGLNHEIEVYVFQFKLYQRMGIEPSVSKDDYRAPNAASFWVAIGNLANLVDNSGKLVQGKTQQEFDRKYMEALIQARIYDPENYGNMGEDENCRVFLNMAAFMFASEK